MQLKEAWKLFSSAYQSRETIEVSIMQKLVTFNSKSVLEITQEKSTVRPLLGKYRKYAEIKPENLKAEQREWDVVFTRWTLQYLAQYYTNIIEAISKMSSLANESVLVVMPSDKGDLTALKMIKDKDTASRRRKRAYQTEQAMKKTGFSTIVIPALLEFRFDSYNQALDVLMATEFQNSVTHNELQQIQEFLRKKTRTKDAKLLLTQGALFIAGSKK